MRFHARSFFIGALTGLLVGLVVALLVLVGPAPTFVVACGIAVVAIMWLDGRRQAQPSHEGA